MNKIKLLAATATLTVFCTIAVDAVQTATGPGSVAKESRTAKSQWRRMPSRTAGALLSTPQPVSAETQTPRKESGVDGYHSIQLFDTQSAIDECTIINGNNDELTWELAQLLACVRLYTFNANKANDWIITPGVRLEAGKYYYVAAEMATGQAKERVEIKVGASADAAAMNINVVEPVEFQTSSDNTMMLGNYISVPATGDYHVGVHGISDPGSFSMMLLAVAIENAVDASAPAACTGFKAVPDAAFGKEAVISGVAPTKTMDGAALSQIESVEIKRDDVTIATLQVPPGASFSYTDNVEKAGRYTYSAVATNAAGAGAKTEDNIFIGVNKPAPATNIVITEDSETLGKVNATWDAVTTDVDGRPFTPGMVTYMLFDSSPGSLDVLETGYTDTNYSWQACDGENQQFCQLLVIPRAKANDSAANGEQAASNLIAIGKPYEIPYSESFDNGELQSIIGYQTFNGSVMWGLSADGTDIEHDADGTGGCVGYYASVPDYSALLHTGKIDLRNAVSPNFRFSLYNAVENSVADENDVAVMVRIDGENEWHTLSHGAVKDLCKNGENEWQQVRTDLSAYVGKVVQVGVCITRKNYEYAFIDAFAISEGVSDNLSLLELKPSKLSATSNETVDFDVKILNNGDQTASGYTVELWKTGSSEPMATVAGPELLPDASTSVRMGYTLDFDDPATLKFYAKVNFAADKDNSDNTSSTLTVSKITSPLDAPTNLTISENQGGGATLSWTSPAEGQPDVQTVTEGFEKYSAFSTNLGLWTLVDADKSPIGGFDGISMPDEIKHTCQSFFIFDREYPGVANSEYADSFEAYNGSKFLGALYRSDYGQLDDWIISPELSGNAQTISLVAKSYSAQYPESIEVLYSTTDKELSSFISVGVENKVPGKWVEYSYDLPAGAKYFAIRAISSDAFFLQIDDVTFEMNTVRPVGYNLYRNSVKVNDSPLTSTTYTDAEATKEASYRVTAVYAGGAESEPSNKVSLSSAVESLFADSGVTTGRGTINVKGASGKHVVISNLAGMVLYSGIANDNLTVNVPQGLYVVRVGGKTLKVMTK